jgi:hypothetical protein
LAVVPNGETEIAEFSPDRLNGVDPNKAGQAALAVIDRLQNYAPEQQLAGAAITFVLLLKKYQQHAGNVLTVANNLMDRTVQHVPQLGAMRDYVRYEL